MSNFTNNRRELPGILKVKKSWYPLDFQVYCEPDYMIYRKIFIGFFFFALIAGLFLQKVIIPLSPWDAGHGLMAGGDWVAFHEEAESVALKIEQSGWKNWSFRPGGNSPVGIASAVYAITGIREPWVLLPLNAILYGGVALVLFSLFYCLSENMRVAFLSLVPLVIFPSNAMIWGQWHKDIWMWFGNLLLLLFWIRIIDDRHISKKQFSLLWLVAGGSLFVWIARAYSAKVFLFSSCVAAAIGCLFRIREPKFNLFWFGTVFLALLIQLMVLRLPQGSALVSESTAPLHNLDRDYITPRSGRSNDWVYQFYFLRKGFIESYRYAGSNIDTDVPLRSAQEILTYLPRAVQIALFAPFPNMWFQRAHQPGGKFMRIVSAFEMLIAYFAFLGWVGLPWHFRNRLSKSLVVGLAFSLSAAVLYTLVICNVGTLYRMRSSMMLFWVGLGCLGWHYRLSPAKESSAVNWVTR